MKIAIYCRVSKIDQHPENQIIQLREYSNRHQYEYEVFAPGTIFTHGFRCYNHNELIESSFWRVIKLFKENPFICAMFNVGNSELDLSRLDIKENGDKLYLDYLQKNKEKIRKFLND